MKLKAFVSNQTDDEIKWLIIESDESDTKGYFIYYYVSENNAFDTWHMTIDEAFQAAYSQYGIKKEDWVVINE